MATRRPRYVSVNAAHDSNRSLLVVWTGNTIGIDWFVTLPSSRQPKCCDCRNSRSRMNPPSGVAQPSANTWTHCRSNYNIHTDTSRNTLEDQCDIVFTVHAGVRQMCPKSSPLTTTIIYIAIIAYNQSTKIGGVQKTKIWFRFDF